MNPSSIVGFLLTLLSVACSGYVNASSASDAETSEVEQAQSRQLGWALDWLSGSGIIGQILANIFVAVFVLPPLGPVICTLLGNCDTLKLRARSLLDPSTPRWLSSDGDLTEDLSHVLDSLDDASNKYT